MPKIKYPIELTEEECAILLKIIEDSQLAERKVIRAYTLLKANEKISDKKIAEALGIAITTVALTRKRYHSGGLEEALTAYKQRSPRQQHKVNIQTEKTLLSLLNQPPPNEKPRWTLHLLASHMIKVDRENAVSSEAIRYTLRRLNISLKRPQI